MAHPENSKNKYKNLKEEIGQLGRLMQQFINLFLITEADLKDLKAELMAKGVIENPDKVEEPEEAKTEEYFPVKSDESKDESVPGE